MLIYPISEVNWASEFPNISTEKVQHIGTQHFLELVTSGNGNTDER